MSEAKEKKSDKKTIQLKGLFLKKLGMSTIFNEAGEALGVTLLKYDPLVVSDIKTQEKHGYTAVQVAGGAKRAARGRKSEVADMKKAGFEHGAQLVREIRQDLQEGIEIGQQVDIESFKKGDLVKVTGTTRGRGFSGVVRRWNFAGGPATHGSGFHRKPGSVGNRTWPGRVIAGKRMAGQYGSETRSLRNMLIVDILPKEGVVIVKGGIPGHRNSLVQIVKA